MNKPATSSPCVLIVDDESLICETLTEYLTQEGFDVVSSNSGEEALARATEQRFDVVLLDVQLPDTDGVDLLDQLLKISPETSVILITAFATVENAIRAFQRGAFDYLMKPLLLEEVANKIRRLLQVRKLELENQWLRRELNRSPGTGMMVGSGQKMHNVQKMIRKVAQAASTVLITGESGTGKELVARAIHDQSKFAERPFIPVNCAAIPNDLLENQLFGHRKGAFTGADRDEPGVFVHAGTGTVLLDEIAEMALATQAKLLRALDQKEVFAIGAKEPVKMNARILASTNKDLNKLVESGEFREDLYYRLNVLTIRLPALRERREDIPDLVEHLLTKHVADLSKPIRGVAHEAMQQLLAGYWKGNVRELDNVIQRAVILGEGPLITLADLPPDLAIVEDDPELVDDLSEAVRRFERRHLQRILSQTPDKKEAAKRLGMGLSSLYRHLEKLGMGTSATSVGSES